MMHDRNMLTLVTVKTNVLCACVGLQNSFRAPARRFFKSVHLCSAKDVFKKEREELFVMFCYVFQLLLHFFRICI